MFFKNFTSLDDEFITLWSSYLVSDKDFSEYKHDLEKIAEKGQMQAICEYYKKSDIGENPVIDKITSSLEGKDHEELLALGLYHSRDVQDLNYFMYVLNEYELTKQEFYHPTSLQHRKEVKSRLTRVEEAMKKTTFLKYLYDAKAKLENIVKNDCNYLFLPAYNEILNQITRFIPFEKEKKQMKKEIENNEVEILVRLMDAFKHSGKTNVPEIAKNFPQKSFSLGKALYSFCNSDDEIQLGYRILCELGGRGQLEEVKAPQAI